MFPKRVEKIDHKLIDMKVNYLGRFSLASSIANTPKANPSIILFTFNRNYSVWENVSNSKKK